LADYTTAMLESSFGSDKSSVAIVADST